MRFETGAEINLKSQLLFLRVSPVLRGSSFSS